LQTSSVETVHRFVKLDPQQAPVGCVLQPAEPQASPDWKSPPTFRHSCSVNSAHWSPWRQQALVD
jgi:hypothetical protein